MKRGKPKKLKLRLKKHKAMDNSSESSFKHLPNLKKKWW